MKLQQLESMPFPKDFASFVQGEAIRRFVYHSLHEPTCTIKKVKVLDAQYLEDDFTHVFTWQHEYMEGAKDGLSEWSDIRFDKPDDLKTWLFFLACAGMPGVEKYGHGGESYLKAWSHFRVRTMGQTMALITCSAGVFLYPHNLMPPPR